MADIIPLLQSRRPPLRLDQEAVVLDDLLVYSRALEALLPAHEAMQDRMAEPEDSWVLSLKLAINTLQEIIDCDSLAEERRIVAGRLRLEQDALLALPRFAETDAP